MLLPRNLMRHFVCFSKACAHFENNSETMSAFLQIKFRIFFAPNISLQVYDDEAINGAHIKYGKNLLCAIFCVIVGPKSRNNCSSTQWAYYSTNGRRRRRRRHINIFQMLMRKYWNQYWFLSEKYPEKNDDSSRKTKFWRNFR